MHAVKKTNSKIPPVYDTKMMLVRRETLVYTYNKYTYKTSKIQNK
jgi:hypothetical protein